MLVYTYGCLVNGVYVHAVVLAFWSTTGITGISLTVNTHLCMAILIFYAMHLTA